MQREIKFRGKSKFTKLFVYGYYHYGVVYPNSQANHYIDNQIINVNTLGQYTGLKDKNGLEIYENDIISCSFIIKDEVRIVMNSLVWDEKYSLNRNEQFNPFLSSWGATDNKTFCCFMNVYDPTRYASVIGNIHDNPELI